MKKHRVHVWIKGRVQGVFFRTYTRDAAQSIGVTGWVRNLPDGRVEAVFEGESDKVERMIEWCREGSPMSRIESVDLLEEVYTGDFDRLAITH
ncbi:MAG: acylphosphatase [Syntrophobacteraceae bacterium]|jgi:acylphosphatase